MCGPTSTTKLFSPSNKRVLPDFKICNFPKIPGFKLFKVQNAVWDLLSFSFS